MPGSDVTGRAADPRRFVGTGGRVAVMVVVVMVVGMVVSHTAQNRDGGSQDSRTFHCGCIETLSHQIPGQHSNSLQCIFLILSFTNASVSIFPLLIQPYCHKERKRC